MGIIICLYEYHNIFVWVSRYVCTDIKSCFFGYYNVCFMDSTICLYSMEITVCLFVYNSMLLTNTLHKVIKVIL